MTYASGNLNSIGLKEKLIAPEERKAEIDNKLKNAQQFSATAFELLDELLADPSRIRLPTATGTKPKKRPREERMDVPPEARPSRANLTLPLIVEEPGFGFPTNPQGEAISKPVSSPVVEKDPPTINNEILQSVIFQLRNEFERLYQNANRTGAVSTPPSQLDEEVSDALEIEDADSVGTPKKHVKPKPNLNRNVKPTIDLKLDRMSLPNFSGALSEWIAFRDQYTDLVHENSNLSPIVKFYQLRACLTGKALEVINGFQLSSTDYEAAWAALKQRR